MFVQFLWLLLIGAPQAGPAAPLALTDRTGRQPRIADGVLTLKPALGPVRSDHWYLDFALAFDVSMEAGTEATVLLRVHDVPASRLEGPMVKLPAATVPGAWRRVEIVADGKRVTLSVDGAVVTTADVSEFAGRVGLEVQTGTPQFRRVTLAPIDRPFEPPPDAVKATDLRARGGTVPRTVTTVSAHYPATVMRQRIQGTVMLDVVVLPDGSVGPVRVAHSLHPDLDVSAIGGVKAWKFTPGRLNGQAVAALVEVEVTFNVRER